MLQVKSSKSKLDFKTRCHSKWFFQIWLTIISCLLSLLLCIFWKNPDPEKNKTVRRKEDWLSILAHEQRKLMINSRAIGTGGGTPPPLRKICSPHFNKGGPEGGQIMLPPGFLELPPVLQTHGHSYRSSFVKSNKVKSLFLTQT